MRSAIDLRGTEKSSCRRPQHVVHLHATLPASKHPTLPAAAPRPAAIHRQVLSLGASVLQQQPVLSLSQACLGPASCLGGPLPAAQPLTKRQLARQQAAAEVAAAAAVAAASMHLSMPLPTPVVVQQTAARVHSPQTDLRAQLLTAQAQLSAGQWGGDTSFDAGVPAGGGLSGLDNMEMPALSLACSLPSQLFDPNTLDLL